MDGYDATVRGPAASLIRAESSGVHKDWKGWREARIRSFPVWISGAIVTPMLG